MTYVKNRISMPRSYWRELNGLDETIYGRAEPVAPEHVGRLIVFVSVAMWGGENQDQQLYWKGRRIQRGPRAAANLFVIETVEAPTLTVGALVDKYTYSVPRRRLYVNHLMIPDVNGDITIGVVNEIESLDKQIGADAVSEGQYDFLLTELHRGASGEFALPIPQSPDA